MAIKDRLKARRIALNMTLEDVSKQVGVTRATIQKYENGIISNIPLDKIETLAEALRTTPAWIMGWENEPSPALPTTSATESTIKDFLSLDPIDQAEIRGEIKAMLKHEKYSTQEESKNA